MNIDKKEAIEICQARLIDGINSFEKVTVNMHDKDLMLTTMYINQLWTMQALNIILEDMKE